MATKQNLNSEENINEEKKTVKKTAARATKSVSDATAAKTTAKKPATRKTAEEKAEPAVAKTTAKKTAAKTEDAEKKTARRTRVAKTAETDTENAETKKTAAVKRTTAAKKTEKAEEKPAARTTASRKTTAAKKAGAEEKPAAVKTSADESVAKAAKKPAARKSAAKPAAVKKEPSAEAAAKKTKETELSPVGVMVKIPVAAPVANNAETNSPTEEPAVSKVSSESAKKVPANNADLTSAKEQPVNNTDLSSAKEVPASKTESNASSTLTAEQPESNTMATPPKEEPEIKNNDYLALEKMMQDSGLRKSADKLEKKTEGKKGKKKIIPIIFLLLALFGTGIGVGIKFFSGMGTSIERLSPEEIIAKAQRLIEKGQYAQALEILSGLNISGNDEKSAELRKKVAGLIKTGIEKALADGKIDEVLKTIEELAAKGKYAEALKLAAIGSSIDGDDENTLALKQKLKQLEKSIAEKAVQDGRAQEVIDTAKQLIESSQEIPALELLNLLDIKGNSTESRMMRNQIYSLKKDAVNKALENGRGRELLDAIDTMNKNGDSVNALELLSYMEVKGNDEESAELREQLDQLKKEAVKKAFEDGKQEEIIARAKQMISDGDYSSALEFLSSAEAEGDDPESRAFRNSIKALKKDTVERALAEGRIDDVFKTADKLNNNEDNASALELLGMVNIAGNSEEAQKLREQLNAKKQETLKKAIENGKTDEIIKQAKQMIADGDYAGALELLSSAKISEDSPEGQKLKKEIDGLKKQAISKAIEEGRGDEILDTVERLMKEGDFESASSIIDQIGKVDATSPEAKAFMDRAERLKKQNEVLSKTGNMSNEEKAKLAEQLIKEGRYDEALTLLNSINADGNDEETKKLQEKISNLKKDAVTKAKKDGVDLGVLGYDENGNPVLSKEEVARRQQQERILQEAAEKKAAEDKLIEQVKKEAEEKLRKEENARKAAEEKLKKEENARKLAEEKRLKQEAEFKDAAAKKEKEEAEKKAKEEAAKIAAEQKLLQEQKAKEEAAKNAETQLRKEIEDSIARGKQLLAQGDIEGAAKEFANAESKLPADDEKYSAEKLDQMAKALYDASEKATGADKKKLENLSGQMAKSALKFSSASPDTLYIAGIDALNKRNFAEAEKFLNDAIAKNPANFMYFYQLGRVLAMQKKYDASIVAFQNSMNINGAYAPACYNSGYVSEQLNKKQDALKYYKMATDVNPAYENAYLGQGHVLMDMGDYSSAAEAFKKALAVNPNRAQIYQELGACLIEKKDYVNAESYLKKALACPDATKEKNALTYYNLSTVMYGQNKKAEALDYAVKAYDARERTENSVKANIVYNYGLMMQDSAKDEDAVRLYNEVLMLDPKHVKANTNLGTVYMKQKKDTEAILALTNAYNVEPDNFEVNNNLGTAYRRISDFTKSAEHYNKALKVNPKDLTVMQNLARTYAAAKDYENARKVYEQLIAKEPASNDHLFELANIAYEKGDSATAAKCLAKLQLIAPDYKADQVDNMLKALGY